MLKKKNGTLHTLYLTRNNIHLSNLVVFLHVGLNSIWQNDGWKIHKNKMILFASIFGRRKNHGRKGLWCDGIILFYPSRLTFFCEANLICSIKFWQLLRNSTRRKVHHITKLWLRKYKILFHVYPQQPLLSGCVSGLLSRLGNLFPPLSPVIPTLFSQAKYFMWWNKAKLCLTVHCLTPLLRVRLAARWGFSGFIKFVS